MTSETKVGKTFPNQQFKINGYKMLRKDRDRFGGGLLFYVNEQIPSKVLSLESIPMDTELILLEFTVKIQRWLCVGIYRPPPQNEKYFINHFSKTLGQLSCQYDKNIMIGDFNLTIDNKSLEKFLQKIRQSSIVFKKPGFLSKKVKTFTSSNYHRFDLIANRKNAIIFYILLITQDLNKMTKFSSTLLQIFLSR